MKMISGHHAKDKRRKKDNTIVNERTSLLLFYFLACLERGTFCRHVIGAVTFLFLEEKTRKMKCQKIIMKRVLYSKYNIGVVNK